LSGVVRIFVSAALGRTVVLADTAAEKEWAGKQEQGKSNCEGSHEKESTSSVYLQFGHKCIYLGVEHTIYENGGVGLEV
jgi:hypothetical protein